MAAGHAAARKRKGELHEPGPDSGQVEADQGGGPTAKGKITGDDPDRIEGRREELVGLVREGYAKVKAEAEREGDTWMKSVK